MIKKTIEIEVGWRFNRYLVRRRDARPWETRYYAKTPDEVVQAVGTIGRDYGEIIVYGPSLPNFRRDALREAGVNLWFDSNS